METWEADTLGGLIAQSWPRSSITADVWAGEFRSLDKPRAEEAVRQLRRTQEHAPSVASFYAVYGRLAGSAQEGGTCDMCDNTGVITDTDHPHHWPGRNGTLPLAIDVDGKPYCICNVARPCRCDHGKRAAQGSTFTAARAADNERPAA